MKTKLFRSIALASFLGLALIAIPSAEGRPPRSIQAEGILRTIDHETHTLVFQAEKDKKPFVLVWDKDSKFMKDGRLATPDSLNEGVTIHIYFRRDFFRNPRIRKVLWEEKADGK